MARSAIKEVVEGVATPPFGPFEPVAEYRYVTGFTWEKVVTTGLVEWAGIVVMDDRMLISDHANGGIIIYAISVIPALEMGRCFLRPLGSGQQGAHCLDPHGPDGP